MSLKIVMMASLGLLIPITGCESFNRNSSNNDTTFQSLSVLRANQDQLLQEIRNNQQAIRMITEQQAQLGSAQMQIQNDIAALNQQVTSVNSRPVTPSASSADIARLQEQIKQIDQARVQSEKQLAEAISKQLNTMNSQIGTLSQRTVSAPANTPNQNANIANGEYFQHVVEARQTIGVIAKAYKVSVDEICKINKIKNNKIYIGQTLLIPKKK